MTDRPSFQRDDVLTPDELAAALRVSKRTVERMDLPTIWVGSRRRYIYGQVLDVLKERAA